MTAGELLRGFPIPKGTIAAVTRWRLTIEYDGGPFMGWQRQDHGPSVQQTLEDALRAHDGRTGGIHVPPGAPMPAFTRWRWQRTSTSIAAAYAAPAERRAQCASPPPPHLHARRRARSPTTGTRASPASAGGISIASSIAGRRRRSMPGGFGISRFRSMLDAMARGAAHLIGRHDFTTFRSAHCQSDSPVKTLDRLEVSRVGDEIHVTAAARSFLHHQVRSMVGCLAMVGRGQWRADDIRRALEARDRAALGFNAPPQDSISSRRSHPREGGIRTATKQGSPRHKYAAYSAAIA